MTIHNQKLINRWNSVMNDVGCEHVTIDTRLSELESHKEYYGIVDGISVDWMYEEAGYWLSCYYEEGNVRCDDRFYSKDSYKVWLHESGRLKRLCDRLAKMENKMVATW